MKVKYNDRYIKYIIAKHNDTLIDVINGYYLVKDSTNGYFFSLNEYLHMSEYSFSTLEELKKYLKLEG